VIVWLPVLLGGLVLAALFEAASVWFADHAVVRLEEDEQDVHARGLAASARGARWLGNLSLAAAFTAAAVLAPADDARITAALIGGALLWSLVGSALLAAHWRSPWSLAGRAVFRPVHGLGVGLRAVLRGSLRVLDLHTGDDVVARVREADRVLGWLAGGEGERETDRVLATVQEFRESEVEDVLVPRADIVAVAVGATVAEVVDLVAREGYSRYPVYRESIDNVVGILHVFDLLGADPGARAEAVARPPLLTSATKPAGQLLREMQAGYQQMAVVADEFGGVAGLVTVEDLLEELVGDLHDETDEEKPQVRVLEPGVWWVDAGARVDDLNEALELDLREGEYDTVAGLVLEQMERIPHPGEKVRVGEVWLEVLAAEPNRVRAFKLTRPGAKPRRNGNGEPRT